MRKHNPINPHYHGFTLVELMVAMVLGLILIAGVISLFVSSHSVFRQNDNLARIQENGRYAFEILGRAMRQAGGIPCSSNIPVANVLNNSTTKWWSNWGDGIHGYEGGADSNSPSEFEGIQQSMAAKAFGTATGGRVAGTDAVIIYSGTGDNALMVTQHNPTSAEFKVNVTNHGITPGDILLVCDYRQAAIFQTSNANQANATIVHNTGSYSPGNCSKGLGYPTQCTTLGNRYTFENGGFISKLSANAWYIGFNGRNGGKSLYRMSLRNNSGTIDTLAEEIVEDVVDMEIQYLQKDCFGNPTTYKNADQITDWTKVTSTRLILTLESRENVGIGNSKLRRNIQSVYYLRNRDI